MRLQKFSDLDRLLSRQRIEVAKNDQRSVVSFSQLQHRLGLLVLIVERPVRIDVNIEKSNLLDRRGESLPPLPAGAARRNRARAGRCVARRSKESGSRSPRPCRLDRRSPPAPQNSTTIRAVLALSHAAILRPRERMGRPVPRPVAPLHVACRRGPSLYLLPAVLECRAAGAVHYSRTTFAAWLMFRLIASVRLVGKL